MSTIKVGDETYEFSLSNPSNRDCMLLENVFDGTFSEWSRAMSKGSIRATTCLVYMLRKRAGQKVNFENVEFNLGEFDVELTGDDKQEDEPVDPTDTTPSEPTETVD